MKNTESPGHWVAAAPFRAHSHHLMAASGLPWRALAVMAGISPRVLQTLLFGHRGKTRTHILSGCASALLALTPTKLDRARSELVAATAAARAAARLRELGWSVTAIAVACGLRPEEVEAALSGRLRFTTRRAEVLVIAAAQAATADADITRQAPSATPARTTAKAAA